MKQFDLTADRLPTGQVRARISITEFEGADVHHEFSDIEIMPSMPAVWRWAQAWALPRATERGGGLYRIDLNALRP